MVEYGGGINKGPAGQVGGGGGAGGGPDVGQPDLFASVSNMINDATTFVTAQPFEVLAVAIVLFFVGLIVLKRAF